VGRRAGADEINVAHGCCPKSLAVVSSCRSRVLIIRRPSGTHCQGDPPVDTLAFYLGEAVPASFGLLLLLVTCLGLGLPLSRRLDLHGNGTALDLSFAVTLGMGLLSAYGVLLGLVGGLVALLTAVFLLLALTPRVFYDALLYHLGSPNHWLMEGFILPEPGVVYSGFPMQSELLAALAMALGGRAAAGLLHAGLGLLLMSAVGAVAARRSTPAGGLAAALLVGSLPMTLWLVFLDKPELTGALFALMAVAALTETSASPRALLGAGVYTALAVACKPVNLLYLGLPLLLLLLRSVRGSSRQGRRALALAAGGALGMLPWVMRDVAFRMVNGEPPGLAGLAPLPRLALLRDIDPVLPSSLPWAPLRALLDPILGGSGTAAEPTWQWLVLLPLLATAAIRKGPARPYLAAGALALLLRACTFHTVRFGYVAFPLLAVAAGITLFADAHWWRRSLRYVTAAVAVWCALMTVAHIESVYSLRIAFESNNGPRRYLEGHIPTLTAQEWIGEHTESTARVLLVGETSRFHLDRRHVVADFVHPNPLHRYLREASVPSEVTARLAGQGFTHVLYCPAEEARLMRKYLPLPLGPRERALLEAVFQDELELLWQRDGVFVFAVPGKE